MNIDNLTIGEAKKLAALFTDNKCSKSHFEIGKYYLIRTVTMIDTGLVMSVSDQEIVLTEAAWIANTGRFADAVKSASFGEVEPFPDGEVIINRGAIVDACRISKSPRSQR